MVREAMDAFYSLDCIDDRGLDLSGCDCFPPFFLFIMEFGPNRPVSVTGKFWTSFLWVMDLVAVILQIGRCATSHFEFFQYVDSRFQVSMKHRLGRLGSRLSHTHVRDRWCCGLTFYLASWVLSASSAFQHGSSHGLVSYAFDSSKGYPGAGPSTLSTINVGSLEKHEEIYHQDMQCLAIQETRITDANSKTCHLHATSYEFDLHCGPHLGYLPSGHPAFF